MESVGRVSDLAPLAEHHNISFEPKEYDLKAGEGLLFEPASVLHVGKLPTAGQRTA